MRQRAQGNVSDETQHRRRKRGTRKIMGSNAHSLSESREVMSLRQASNYLGVSADTMYRYVSEGLVPAFKLGNRWKLRKSVLDRWMERKMSQARPKRRH